MSMLGWIALGVAAWAGPPGAFTLLPPPEPPILQLGDAVRCTWSPDGTQLLLASAGGRLEVLAGPAYEARTLIRDFAEPVRDLRVRRDGVRLFVATAGAGYGIDLSGPAPRLVYADPDADYASVRGHDHERPALTVAPVDDDVVQVYADGGPKRHYFVFGGMRDVLCVHPSGDSLVRRADGGAELVTQSHRSYPVVPLDRVVTRVLGLSPDERTLIFSAEHHGARLWTAAAPTRTVPVDPRIEAADFLSWAPDSEAFVTVRTPPHSQRIGAPEPSSELIVWSADAKERYRANSPKSALGAALTTSPHRLVVFDAEALRAWNARKKAFDTLFEHDMPRPFHGGVERDVRSGCITVRDVVDADYVHLHWLSERGIALVGAAGRVSALHTWLGFSAQHRAANGSGIEPRLYPTRHPDALAWVSAGTARCVSLSAFTPCHFAPPAPVGPTGERRPPDWSFLPAVQVDDGAIVSPSPSGGGVSQVWGSKVYRSAAYSPSGHRIAVGLKDAVMVLDAEGGRWVDRQPCPPEGAAWIDDEWLRCGDDSLWRPGDGPPRPAPPGRVVAKPNTRLRLIVHDGQLALWDLLEDRPRWRIPVSEADALTFNTAATFFVHQGWSYRVTDGTRLARLSPSSTKRDVI